MTEPSEEMKAMAERIADECCRTAFVDMNSLQGRQRAADFRKAALSAIIETQERCAAVAENYFGPRNALRSCGSNKGRTMTQDKVEQSLLTVTAEDREAFRSICLGGDTGPEVSAMLEKGAWDDDFRMQELARHRQSSNAAERGGMDRKRIEDCINAAIGLGENGIFVDVEKATESILASLSTTPAAAMAEIQRLGQEYDGEAVREALAGLEWTEDGYSLRTPYDGDVDGDGRHVVVGGEVVVTFADSEIGDEYRERIRAALRPQEGEVSRG